MIGTADHYSWRLVLLPPWTAGLNALKKPSAWLKVEITMKMRLRESIGRELVRMNNGRFLIGLVQFPLTVAMALKIFNLPDWTYKAFIPIAAIAVWFAGWVYERIGVRRHFDREMTRFWRQAIQEDTHA